MSYKMKKWRSKRQRTSRKFLLVLIPLLISLSLLGVSLIFSDKGRLLISSPFSPIQKAFLRADHGVRGAFSWLHTSWGASAKVKTLQDEVQKLRNQIVNKEATIARLEGELELLAQYYKESEADQKPIVAHVIAYDTSDFRKTLLVDVGSRHGVLKNSVVLTKNALVGKVAEVGPYTSRVLLITDPASRIPARVLETSELGVVEGTSSLTCRLKYLPKRSISGEKNHKGFRVVSTSIGGGYPDSFYIATVVEAVEEEDVPYKVLRLKPAVDPAQVDVLLVLNPPFSYVTGEESKDILVSRKNEPMER